MPIHACTYSTHASCKSLSDANISSIDAYTLLCLCIYNHRSALYYHTASYQLLHYKHMINIFLIYGIQAYEGMQHVASNKKLCIHQLLLCQVSLQYLLCLFFTGTYGPPWTPWTSWIFCEYSLRVLRNHIILTYILNQFYIGSHNEIKLKRQDIILS